MFQGFANSFRLLEKRFIPPPKNLKNNQIHGYFYCSYEQPSKPTNDVTFDFTAWSIRILVVACERFHFQAGVNWSLLHGISAFFTFTLHQQWPYKPPHKAPPRNGIPKHGQLFCRVPWDQPPTKYSPEWPQEQMFPKKVWQMRFLFGKFWMLQMKIVTENSICGNLADENPPKPHPQMKILRWIFWAETLGNTWVLPNPKIPLGDQAMQILKFKG